MNRELPHDPYIRATVIALTKADLEPDGWWTSNAEIDPYKTGPDVGCTTMLDAHLVWTKPTEAHEDGIHLVWEHPAEQWQWAPRGTHGVLQHAPEFLASLPRWVDPAVVVIVVRELLAGRAAPTAVGPLWLGHEEAQAAVDAWAAAEAAEQ